jgi:hypothetical protein
VAMAWYDYYFNCDVLPLRRGELGGITKQFKPPSHEKEKQEEHTDDKKDKKMRMILIYLSHLLFIVPLLVYIAAMKKKINPIVYPLLGVLALFTAGYHGVALMGSHA